MRAIGIVLLVAVGTQLCGCLLIKNDGAGRIGAHVICHATGLFEACATNNSAVTIYEKTRMWDVTRQFSGSIMSVGDVVEVGSAFGFRRRGNILQCLGQRNLVITSRTNLPSEKRWSSLDMQPGELVRLLRLDRLGPSFPDIQYVSVEVGAIYEESVSVQLIRDEVLRSLREKSLPSSCLAMLYGEVFVATSVILADPLLFDLTNRSEQRINLADAGSVSEYFSYDEGHQAIKVSDGRIVSGPIVVAVRALSQIDPTPGDPNSALAFERLVDYCRQTGSDACESGY